MSADPPPTIRDGPGAPEPLTRPVAARPAEERVLGPYRLLRRIGEGGMGEVWLAEQVAPVRRTVAIKVIKRGMDSRQVIARFQAERQALAMMDHPAIARVFDAGETPLGRPYFVMEHVRGVPIHEYCDRHRLSIRQRLELFRQVCDGVQHAHQKAVIHRDLKPSNILVAEQDGRPAPKIIDFGVAKAIAQRLTERTMYTELGQIVGTPEYMSPEQAELTGEDVDTRTDVYSLGVVLYQLLVGDLPLNAQALRTAGPEGLRRMIREQEPRRPSTRIHTLGEATSATVASRRTERGALVRQIAGDLDWITLKALEKERNRRYGSPQELADDVGRFLDDRPIEARPPSAAYRMSKFARRHRTGVGLAATLLALLVAFAAAMTVQAGRIARERDQKEQALAEAEAVTGFLAEMLSAVKPDQEGRDATVREVLDGATDRLEETFADRPAVESRLRTTIASSYNALGLYAEAEGQLRAAWTTRRELLGVEDPDTLMTGFLLANVLYNRGRYADAEALHREVLAARRQVLGAEHTETLWSLGNLAMALAAQERYAEAEPLLTEALATRRRLLGVDHAETLVLMNNLAALYHMLGRLDEAEPLYREAVEVSARLRGEKHPDTLAARSNLGELYADLGRAGEAEPLLVEVLEDKRQVLGADHPSTLYTLGVLAGLYRDQGRFELAAPLLAEAVAGKRQRLGPEHRQTLASIHDLAEVYRRQGRLDEAEALATEALATARRALGADHPVTLAALHGLAGLRAAQGRRAEAVALLAELLETARASGRPLPFDPFADPDLAPLAGDPALTHPAAPAPTPAPTQR